MPRVRALFYILMLILIAGFGLGAPDRRENSQQVRMRAAAEHIPKLMPLIMAAPEFSQVTCYVFTGLGGSLCIQSRFTDEETFSRLRSIVESSNPPVSILFMLESSADGQLFSRTIEHP
jgi:hypothetical protein